MNGAFNPAQEGKRKTADLYSWDTYGGEGWKHAAQNMSVDECPKVFGQSKPMLREAAFNGSFYPSCPLFPQGCRVEERQGRCGGDFGLESLLTLIDTKANGRRYEMRAVVRRLQAALFRP